jgi:adenylate cyclase class 2
MMSKEYEVEVKVPCENLDAVRKRLLEMGATDGGEKDQEDIYLSHPCWDLGERDEALRLRGSGGRWRITYKGPKVDERTKTREEMEMEIDPRIEGVLERMGFERRMILRKTRHTMMLGNVEFALDRVDGLGSFVELEYKGDSVEEGKGEILSLMEELGLEGGERRSYLELMIDKRTT